MRTAKSQGKYSLYLMAFQNTARAYSEDQGQDVKPYIIKLIVYGVKAVNTKPAVEFITREEALNEFQFISVIMDLIGTLTPADFMSIFPIEKEYQGHRWGTKDYFYTRDYINTLERDKPIGEATDSLEFMWKYSNWEIRCFNVAAMCNLSKLRQMQGHPSLAQEWAEMNGLKTYTMYADQKGRKFLFDKNTGKTVKTKKIMPRYLRVVH